MKHEGGEQTDYRCREDFLQKLGPKNEAGGDDRMIQQVTEMVVRSHLVLVCLHQKIEW